MPDPGFYLFSGLNQLGQQIAAGEERRKQEAQEASALRKLITLYRPDLKDQATTADLGTLRGVSQAIHAQDLAQERQSQQALRGAQVENYQALAADRAAHQQRIERMQNQADVLGQYINNAMEFENKPFDQAFREGALKFPMGAEQYMLHPAFKALIDEAQQKRSAFFPTGQGEAPIEGDLGRNWSRIVTGPNQAQVVPKIQPELQGTPILGPLGEDLGTGIQTGKGVQIIKTPTQSKLTPAVNPANGQPMNGFFFDQTGKLHDLRDQMQKLGIGSTGSAGAPPAVPGASPGTSGQTIKDTKGRSWVYTGTAKDPKTDRDPSHWTLQQ